MRESLIQSIFGHITKHVMPASSREEAKRSEKEEIIKRLGDPYLLNSHIGDGNIGSKEGKKYEVYIVKIQWRDIVFTYVGATTQGAYKRMRKHVNTAVRSKSLQRRLALALRLVAGMDVTSDEMKFLMEGGRQNYNKFIRRQPKALVAMTSSEV